MNTKQLSILVICTGNSCRSQMAEGFFRHFGRDRVKAHSAGVKPQEVNPAAVRVMAELGIDISRQQSTHLDEYRDGTFDFVITVCDNAAAACPTYFGDSERLHWPFDDPALTEGDEETRLAVFRRVRDEISIRVLNWSKENRTDLAS